MDMEKACRTSGRMASGVSGELKVAMGQRQCPQLGAVASSQVRCQVHLQQAPASVKKKDDKTGKEVARALKRGMTLMRTDDGNYRWSW